jgi:hypothetical protein
MLLAAARLMKAMALTERGKEVCPIVNIGVGSGDDDVAWW